MNFLFGGLAIGMVGLAMYVGVGPWGEVFVGEAAIVLYLGYAIAAITFVSSFVGMVCTLYRASCALKLYLTVLVLVILLQSAGLFGGYWVFTSDSSAAQTHSGKLSSTFTTTAENAINVGQCEFDSPSTTNATSAADLAVLCAHDHFDWFE